MGRCQGCLSPPEVLQSEMSAKKKNNPKTDPFWDAQIPALLILLFAAPALMKPGIITSAFLHAAGTRQGEK